MTTTRTLWTAEDLFSLPDGGKRYELLDGELHEMTPPGLEHASVLGTLAVTLGSHVHSRGLGKLLVGDPGIILRRSPDRVRGPDACYIVPDRLPGGKVPVGFSEVVPDFVVEIVSPGDTAAEVHQKIQEWLQAGVRLVWAMYPSTRSVIAFQSATEIRMYRETDVIDGAPVFPGFQCAVGEFFS